MKPSKEIRQAFDAIAKQAVDYANEPDEQRKYLQRLLNVFDNHMSRTERLYLFSALIQALHYRNIITSDDVLQQLHVIRVREYVAIAALAACVVGLCGYVFGLKNVFDPIVSMIEYVKLLITF